MEYVPVPAKMSLSELSFCLSLLSFMDCRIVDFEVAGVTVITFNDPNEFFRSSMAIDCLLAMANIRVHETMSITRGKINPNTINIPVYDNDERIFSPQNGIASGWNLYSPHPNIGASANAIHANQMVRIIITFLLVVAWNGYSIGLEIMKYLSMDMADSE